MSKILSDRIIKKSIIGKAILNSQDNRINSNGLELRLGNEVRFSSTGEKKTIKDKEYLVIKPGEKVFISSYEKIDFSKENIEKIFGKGKALVAFINPTTTIMREGISQVATKIDSGFKGFLSWSIRNGSAEEKLIAHGESVFKITIFLLESEEEFPEQFYGDNIEHKYQNSKGLEESKRLISSTISKELRVESENTEKFSLKTLKEMGGAFAHMANELERIESHIDGKFDILSKELERVDNDIKDIKTDIKEKINQSEKNIIGDIKDFINNAIQGNNLKLILIIVSFIPLFFGLYSFSQVKQLTNTEIGMYSMIIFALIILAGVFISKKK